MGAAVRRVGDHRAHREHGTVVVERAREDGDVAQEQRARSPAASVPGRVVLPGEVDEGVAADGVARLRVDHVDAGLGIAPGTVAVVAGPGGVHGHRRLGAQGARLERTVRAVRAAGGKGEAGVAENLRHVGHAGEHLGGGAARPDAGVGDRSRLRLRFREGVAQSVEQGGIEVAQVDLPGGQTAAQVAQGVVSWRQRYRWGPWMVWTSCGSFRVLLEGWRFPSRPVRAASRRSRLPPVAPSTRRRCAEPPRRHPQGSP